MEFPDKYQCKGKVWLWNFEKGSWHFFTIDGENANQIYFANSFKTLGNRRGFGSIKVNVTIGDSVFTTSIFPNSKDKTYVLPIKAKIRKAENINAGDEISLWIELI